ncbi:MAG TPA: BON domain-containing protein [Polyangiaceae bacterium]|nr:BON domain-containing protein [Polyangiaceae bacterium]
MKSDQEIQSAVSDELAWDCRVDQAAIGVHVRSGIVTLSGTVDAWSKRVAAEEAAHRVAGVLDVANDVRVSIPATGSRTDTQIAEAVRHALEWNVLVPHRAIRTTVTDGEVVLEGEVEYLTQRDDAEKAIRHLAGVRFITNRIVVKAPRNVRLPDVRDAIHDALERRAARESDRIHVDAVDGAVTLSGTCRTWGDKKAVVGAARGTAGVHTVRDQLRIEP